MLDELVLDGPVGEPEAPQVAAVVAATPDDIRFPAVAPVPDVSGPLVELAWLLAGLLDATATVLRRWAR